LVPCKAAGWVKPPGGFLSEPGDWKIARTRGPSVPALPFVSGIKFPFLRTVSDYAAALGFCMNPKRGIDFWIKV
jgi:hypothetical protein